MITARNEKDISTSHLGASRKTQILQLLTQCQQLGITHSESSPTILSKDQSSFARFKDRIDCTNTLLHGDAGLKDLGYLELLDQAANLLPTQEGIIDFTNRIAGRRDETPKLLRLTLNAMRLEFILATNELEYLPNRRRLTTAAINFIDNSHSRKDAYRDLDNAWQNQSSVADFYAALFSRDRGVIVAAWFFQEIPIFRAYYSARIGAGSDFDPLSRLLLEGYRCGIKTSELTSQIAEAAKQKSVPRGILPVHRNYLAHGQAYSPHFPFVQQKDQG